MHCEWLHEGDETLLLLRVDRRHNAESYIHAMPLIVPLQSSHLSHNGRIWASDGSMVPATSGLGDPKSVTAALTGPKTIILQLDGRNISILQGELIGLIMGLILSSSGTEDAILYSDHMNSVHFIEDSRSSISQEKRLRNMNGRSYYRWISDLARETRTVVTYTKGHSKEVTLASQLNNEADYYASKSQNVTSSIHPAPTPTFYIYGRIHVLPPDRWLDGIAYLLLHRIFHRQDGLE
jgi:hypothetical protein